MVANKPKTSNQAYLSRNVKHSVELQRYQRGVIKDIVKELDKAEPRLRRRIIERLDEIDAAGIDLSQKKTAQLTAFYNEIRRINAEAHKSVDQKLTKDLTDLGIYEVDFQVHLTNQVLPVDIALAVPSVKTIKSLVTEKPFQGKLLGEWMSQFERNDSDRMIARIRQGIADGETPTVIARGVFGTASTGGTDGVRQISRRGAASLVQTASSHVANRAREELWQENTDVYTEVMWVSTLDGRTSDICKALDGQRWPVGQGKRPPAHINCRSTVVAVINGKAVGARPAVAVTDKSLKGLSVEDRRAAITKAVGQRPATETYSVWLEDQDKAFVEDVLGKDKAKAFLSGKATLDQFVSPAGKSYTLKELRQKEII